MLYLYMHIAHSQTAEIAERHIEEIFRRILYLYSYFAHYRTANSREQNFSGGFCIRIVRNIAQYCPIEIVKWFNINFEHLPDFSVVTAQVAEHEEARLSLHIFAL